MMRTKLPLIVLVIALSSVGSATSAVAAQPTPPTIEDQHDRLQHNLEATQAERTEAAVQQVRSGERNLTQTASATRVEDQHDRLLRNMEAAQAEGTQAAVQLARAMERNLPSVPAVGGSAAQPTGRSDPAVPGRDLTLLATLLVGLTGGLIGGTAAMAGWTAASRRRPHRAASAT